MSAKHPRQGRRHAIDQAARELAQRRNVCEFQLGRLLVIAQDAEVERAFGFTFWEWAERRFGLGRRAAEDRLRVARSLSTLPEIDRRFERGEVSYSVVRELVRVAEPDTERDWIEAAQAKTGGQVQRMVRGRVRGDAPDDPPEPEAEVHRVTFKLSPLVRSQLAALRRERSRELGRRVEDDELLGELIAGARQPALSVEAEAPREKHRGKAAFQIQMYVCELCGDGEHPGGLVARADEVAAAFCDAQVVPEGGGRAKQTVPPSVRREVLGRQKSCCAVPGCDSRIVDVHHIRPEAEGGAHEPGNLLAICRRHHGAAHVGALLIRGRWPDVRFEHADGTTYGSSDASASRSEVMADAFETLKSLGYQETDARRLLDQIRTAVREQDGVPEVLTYALRAAPDPGQRAGSVARETASAYLRVA